LKQCETGEDRGRKGPLYSAQSGVKKGEKCEKKSVLPLHVLNHQRKKKEGRGTRESRPSPDETPILLKETPGEKLGYLRREKVQGETRK